MGNLEIRRLTADVLIVGGGTAGCFAALTIAAQSAAKVLVAEKAQIKRSGCLAAGVNALNAYIVKGQTPQSYLEYVRNDAAGIIREDLGYSLAERFNRVTNKLEELGLVIQKDEHGEYAARGKRNIRINGENIKPLLAAAVEAQEQVEVLNRVAVIDYILRDGQVVGAYGLGVDEEILYVFNAKAVLCATGGAAGLYRPNNPGASRHKMWYSPFNTGAGYAMGIRAGAELTTLEMRFIALRCKDTIAPTGTIAQGVRAPQVNAVGAEYEARYGELCTANRLYSTVQENRAGRGPCVLRTQGITADEENDLFKAYLNMAPAQTLRWVEQGRGPAAAGVEIEGTEPYVVGGHTASGYWVDRERATTLPGLYAAGDVAGGSPQKYVTGCLAEGEIAAEGILRYIKGRALQEPDAEGVAAKARQLEGFLQTEGTSFYTPQELEEAMQKIMDDYAGGIATQYGYQETGLKAAQERIGELLALGERVTVSGMYELVKLHEVFDRLYVCQALLCHLLARRETRWHAFQENLDYPQKDDANWLKYVNSRWENGQFTVKLRELVTKDERYEHTH